MSLLSIQLRAGLMPRLGLALAAIVGLAGLGLVGWGCVIKAKAGLAQVLLESAFDESLTRGAPVKAWPWADTWPVARIEAPRLGAEAVVLAGASGEALAFGPSHLSGTPMPGQSGTAVFAAHRDTHFRFLGALQPGDRLRLTTATGARLDYRVARMRVAPFDASGIDPAAPGETLALVTCWPLDGSVRGPLRYIVEAERITAAAAAVPAGRGL